MKFFIWLGGLISGTFILTYLYRYYNVGNIQFFISMVFGFVWTTFVLSYHD